MYRARRRRLPLGVALILILAYSAGRVLNDTGQARMPTARMRIDHRRTVVSAVSRRRTDANHYPQENT